MYDLNLSVPNISSAKYSESEKFLLLKNYLYELNETLSYALSNVDITNLSSTLKYDVEVATKTLDYYEELKKDALERFNKLKNQLIVTADEIFQNYTTEIEKTEKEILLKAEKDFVAKSEFGEYKNEVNTAIKQNADTIKLNAENIENAENSLESFKLSNNTELSLQATSIISQVESMFTSKSEVQEFMNTVSSQITQTAESITEHFKNDFEVVDANITDVSGSVAELVYSLDAYIKRGELENGVYGIEIGRSDSNIKARFTNDKLSFFQGNVEVAYVSGNNLYILRAEITDYLKIGNKNDGYFIFDVTNNGLEVRWLVGG